MSRRAWMVAGVIALAAVVGAGGTVAVAAVLEPRTSVDRTFDDGPLTGNRPAVVPQPEDSAPAGGDTSSEAPPAEGTQPPMNEAPQPEVPQPPAPQPVAPQPVAPPAPQPIDDDDNGDDDADDDGADDDGGDDDGDDD